MENTSLSLIQSYPKDKFTLLVAIETVAKVSEIQSPVITAVSISTKLDDKEIYVQEKERAAYTDPKTKKKYQSVPAKYALTKRGLTKLAEAAGIKMVSSEPVLPSTCQKCSTINRATGKFIPCGQCGNKDVKYKVTISVPQLTGETLYFTDHHEINIETATPGMSDKQKAEFLRHLSQMCEAKALNGAIRTALQIKGTYLLEEFQKPFVVAYLVPNLDNPDVKRVAIESMFRSTQNLFGNTPVMHDSAAIIESQHIENIDYKDVIEEVEEKPHSESTQDQKKQDQEDRSQDFRCDKCSKVIPEKVWNYSYENSGQPLCFDCQKIVKREMRGGR